MLEWKVGNSFQRGYLLKIACRENLDILSQNFEEKFFKLVMLKEGTALLNINDKSIVVTSPSIFCLNHMDTVKFSDNAELELNTIYFHPNVVNYLLDCDNVSTENMSSDWAPSTNQDRYLLIPFFERKDSYSGCLKVEVNAFNKMIQLFDKLQNQMTSEVDDNWPCRCRSYLIEILIMLQMKYLDNSDTEEFLELNDSDKEINNILDFIHSSYSSRITIDILTKRFNINRNTLNKRFNDLTGHTPISYLIKHRLKVAESLLINTQVPVSEICERVGFSELTNFIRSFKKEYGESPSLYRGKYSTK